MRVHAFTALGLAFLSAASRAIAQASGQIEAPDATPGERVYFEGRPLDAVLLPDGSIAYLMERPPADTRHDSENPWVLIAHPVLGRVTTPIDPITGQRAPIGTDPDGTYHGFAWFVDDVPFDSENGTTWAPLYETHPPNVENGRAESAAPPTTFPGAGVQKWWDGWDDWLEKLRAADLVPHSGVVSGCRETEEGTVVTMKGDGTFQFLYRDRDRITYEGSQASGVCDLVGQRVTVWTLPCDDGPCIRKIQADDGPSEPPKAPAADAAVDSPVAHPGLIDSCRPSEGATVVTVKGSGTFQFLHRSRDRVVYEGVQAGSPCDLIGRNVVVWTVACDEDSPCISRVQSAAP